MRQLGDEDAFIVAGGTQVGDGGDAFLMKIECDGDTVWTKRYHVGDYSIAYDIVRAQRGGSGSTSVGDLLVCGWMEKKPEYGGINGFIMRTDPQGNTVWCSTINLGAVPRNSGPATSAEYFSALTECLHGVDTGDVVAVGAGWDPTNVYTQDACVARVNGTNGRLTGGTSRGGTFFGGIWPDEFQGVRELTISPYAGDLVFVGTTQSNTEERAGHPKIYLVHTGPDPCDSNRQRVIGDPDSTIIELGMDVAEITQSGLYDDAFDPGDLAITGGATNDSVAAKEMFLIPVHIATLDVDPSTGRLFGDGYPGTAPWTGDYDEFGESIQETDTGFILCGWSKGNLKHAVTPDVVNMYLVRTNDLGSTLCDNPWNPDTAIVS